MSLLSVKKAVLSKIEPSEKEEEKINKFIKDLLRVSKVVSKAEPIITGSLGRGTWLKGDHDIDLFLMFDRGVSRDGLERSGLENGKEIVSQLSGKYNIKYAEHPYVRANFNGLHVDIVPCYSISRGEKIISAVDRSPLHVEYVITKLDRKRRGEVRLLKQFCKGIGIYGSDARNLGVAGYLCELLVIKYGSFENVLKNISRLDAGSIIDVENHWKDNEENERHLRKIFKGQPLILIDPVDRERNVAASLSCGNFVKFSTKSSEFIKKPSQSFFFPKKKPLGAKEVTRLHKRGTKFFAVSFCKPDIIDDILYPQLRKTLERLVSVLHSNEFRVIRSHVFVSEKTEKVFLVLEMECWSLPFINNMVGPPVLASKNSKDFLRKYANPLFGPFVDGQDWVIEKKRNFTMANMAVRDFLRGSPKKLHEKGVPEHIAGKICRFNILQHEDFWKLLKSDREFSSFIREKYFVHL